jgi:hypothetical protein
MEWCRETAGRMRTAAADSRGGWARPHVDTEHTAKLELVEARPVGLGVVLRRDHPAKG